MTEPSPIRLHCENTNLANLKDDYLYHLGLSTKDLDFKLKFGNVKFVCVGGSAHRIKTLAQHLAKESGLDMDPPNLAGSGARFVLYKVESVLMADHGMGTPSLSILLHEMFKLIDYAECKDVTFIRLGTCGGIGLPPGTIVITTESLNTKFQPCYELNILGKTVQRPTSVDLELVDEIYTLAHSLPEPLPVVKGKTVCANDFYEEQARLDGAFCHFSEQDKLAYLQQAYELGVRNFEMECTCFAAQCRMAGVRAAVVCATLVNRLSSDQVAITPEEYMRIQGLPSHLITAFLKKRNALLLN